MTAVVIVYVCGFVITGVVTGKLFNSLIWPVAWVVDAVDIAYYQLTGRHIED